MTLASQLCGGTHEAGAGSRGSRKAFQGFSGHASESRAPKKQISKNKDRDIPCKLPYNEAQEGRDIPIQCLCLRAFGVPKRESCVQSAVTCGWAKPPVPHGLTRESGLGSVREAGARHRESQTQHGLSNSRDCGHLCAVLAQDSCQLAT